MTIITVIFLVIFICLNKKKIDRIGEALKSRIIFECRYRQIRKSIRRKEKDWA